MKSTEVYSLLRAELAPPMKALGFKRQKSFLSWSRFANGMNTVLWCQVSRDGWDEYAGSKFVVELQRSVEAEPGVPAQRRQRLAKLIGIEQKERIRQLQNDIIKSLRRPPSTYPVLHAAPEVTRWYLARFEPVHSPYSPGEDIWLRYAQPDQVSEWGRLLVAYMPMLLEAIERVA